MGWASKTGFQGLHHTCFNWVLYWVERSKITLLSVHHVRAITCLKIKGQVCSYPCSREQLTLWYWHGSRCIFSTGIGVDPWSWRVLPVNAHRVRNQWRWSQATPERTWRVPGSHRGTWGLKKSVWAFVSSIYSYTQIVFFALVTIQFIYLTTIIYCMLFYIALLMHDKLSYWFNHLNKFYINFQSNKWQAVCKKCL